MSRVLNIVFGKEASDFVRIESFGRADSEGWFHANVRIRVEGWSGSADVCLMSGELADFGRQLQRLYKDLKGTASLKPLEPYIEMTLQGDGYGHVRLTGLAKKQLGSDTSLRFALEMNQTELPALSQALIDAEPENHPAK